MIVTLLASGALLFSPLAPSAKTVSADSGVNGNHLTASSLVGQVSNSKATVKQGNYKLKYNTNVRTDAGTKSRIIITAKKGAVAKASHSKKVGKTTWYKVKVQGKTGWVSSSLLTKVSANSTAPKKVQKKVAKTSNSAAKKHYATYKLKYNSNIRVNAGTNHRIVVTAKKGAVAKASYSKKIGKTTWYKVNVQGKTGWVSSSLVTTYKKAPAKKVSKASNSVDSAEVVSIGKNLLGVPYVFGGTTTRGFDCSGFTQYVFQKSGQSLSRTTQGQFAETTKVSSPEPGDLVFFAGTYRPGISHVGIYIGNNQFVHAGGKKSEIRSLNDSYWKKHFHSFKRK